MSAAPAFTVGPYLVGPRIATGGMGEVYVALKQGPGGFRKPVALKLLLPHLSEDAQMVRMFLEEARLAAQMSHPNVVEIYDVGVEAGRHFIAMELVRGVSLSALLRHAREQGEQVSASLLAYVGQALCDGLQHAHQLVGADGHPLEVVHRDVSPQNVLVSSDGKVKLTDFGIARARDSRGLTEPGTLKGKFEYLAPEQLAGQPVDRRADVYAAALTLFEMATGVSPFHRATEALTLDAVRLEPLPALSSLRPDLPEAFEVALRQGAMKAVAQRCPTALALRQLLPPPDPSAPAELAAFVGRHGQATLARIEEQTASFVAVATRPTGTVAPAFRFGRGAVALGGVVLLAALGLWRWTARAPLPVAAPAAEHRPEAALVRAEATPVVPLPPVTAAVVDAGAEPAEESRVAKGPGARPVAPRSRGVGYVSVDAVPWASVYLGDKKIGDTPIDHFPVQAGVVSLVFKGPPDAKSVTRRLTVAAGKSMYLKVDLRK